MLVHGASGGVGIGAVQLARARGLTVIGTAGTEKGRRMVLEQGAHHVLDHGAAGYLEECVKLTGGRGPDIIMEMLANANLQKDLGAIATRGRRASTPRWWRACATARCGRSSRRSYRSPRRPGATRR